MAHSVRRAALDLVTAVTGDGRLLSEVLGTVLDPLPPNERAAAQRLATGALRWAGRSDQILGPYLRNRPEPRVHAMLRIGVWEICGEGAAAHGVVNEAVSIMRADKATQSKAGMVNAVLRNVVRGEVDWDAHRVPEMPKWLRKPLIAAYGKPAVVAMEAVQAEDPPVDLTMAPSAPEGLAEELGGEVLPTGSVRLRDPGQISALPGYEAGHWWVQDAAAALPARILGVQAGERVLDLCAAPGGKTLQLAAAGADVWAVDISEARMGRVVDNLTRCGLKAETVVADALTWDPDAPFDAILLDAPCSATGTIRRHPDLPHAKTGAEIETLLPLQSDLVDRAVASLKPGGRLVFCTCSLFPEEGEEQVAAALARHDSLEVDTGALGVPGVEPDWIGPHGLRIRPDFWAERGGVDGFYISALRKIA